jgi:hypothetical protein
VHNLKTSRGLVDPVGLTESFALTYEREARISISGNLSRLSSVRRRHAVCWIVIIGVSQQYLI